MGRKLYKNIKEFFSECGNGKVMIASHRGSYGGQIPENTIDSCEFALRYGADIVEVDVARTIDGGLVLMHGPEVDILTTGHGLVREHTFEEIKDLKILSAVREIMNKSVDSLDEFLEHFKDKCIINLDRCWDYMDEVFDAVKRHGMVDQIVFKSPKPVAGSIKWLESRDFEPNFMPIIKKYEELQYLLESPHKNKIHAVELVFREEDSKLIAPETIKRLHDNNIKVWVNSLNINEPLTAGHNDTVSVLGSPDDGWGWLVDKGADILQTDFVTELNMYLTSRMSKLP